MTDYFLPLVTIVLLTSASQHVAHAMYKSQNKWLWAAVTTFVLMMGTFYCLTNRRAAFLNDPLVLITLAVIYLTFIWEMWSTRVPQPKRRTLSELQM